MNKKLVVIAAVLLFIIGAMFVVSSFVFGLGGTSSKSYDTSYSGLKSQNEFERKIISTADLQLEVNSVPSAVNMITNITLQQGGFISGSSVNGYEERKSGQVTVRVPQNNFHAAIEQIEALGTVKSRNIRGQDVTEEYIDNTARLDNLKKQENRLSEILKMANTVKDVLEVEKELERVRGEIERLTGRMNYLEQSIEMSTISVDIDEPAPFFEGWGIADSFKQAVNGFIQTINALVIFTGTFSR